MRGLLDKLRNPQISLPMYGMVHDQESGRFVKYNPRKISRSGQAKILDYYANPPLTAEGMTTWLTVVGGRQWGKSLVCEYAAYVKAAYTPGFDHMCLADTSERAEYLHRRVHHLHTFWPDEIKSPTKSTREIRQLTFEEAVGGKMRTLSAEASNAGIGQSPDSAHFSEAAFYQDFGGLMSLVLPSIRNRANSLVVWETTPWQNEAFLDHYISSYQGKGRLRHLFVPYWDGVLNRRPWQRGWTLTQEEIALLTRFSDGDEVRGEGLTLENLAFRRDVIETDVEIRRNPKLFNAYYPTDDVSCWLESGGSVFSDHVLDAQMKMPLRDWGKDDTLRVYEDYRPGCTYVVGVDPCGFAARDHASIQVLRIGQGEIVQAAVYAAHADPLELHRVVNGFIKQYHKPLVVVESNGVGQSLLAMLLSDGYPRVYHERKRKPGIATTAKSQQKMLTVLVDELLDGLVIQDRDTLQQLRSYKNDKYVEENPRSETQRGQASKSKRPRHHWDKVSALMVGIVVAANLPRGKIQKAEVHPRFPERPEEWTFDHWQAHKAASKTKKSTLIGWDHKLQSPFKKFSRR